MLKNISLFYCEIFKIQVIIINNIPTIMLKYIIYNMLCRSINTYTYKKENE